MARRKAPRAHSKASLQQTKMKVLESALVARKKLSGILGQSFDGDRDLYEALGYYLTLTFRQYYGRFERQDIAHRIITAYPDATWRGIPSVYTQDGPESDSFGKEWSTLVKDLNVYHYFNRVDTLAGIGQYAVLLIGFNDGMDLDQPCTRASEVMYLMPYSEQNAEVVEVENDPKNSRYSMPTVYRLQMQTGGTGDADKRLQAVNVHYTRLIHVAEGLLESEIYGTPRLRPVFNRLEDLQRITGGSAEMFWKGAFPGWVFTAKDDADFDTQDIDDFSDELEEYFHGMKRYIRLLNMEAKSLGVQVADPEKHAELQLKLISGTTGIPIRILIGSERGELSSAQDENNWNSRVEERRLDFAEPFVLRAFITRLGDVGILTVPEEYVVDWPDLKALPEKEQAEIGLNRAKTLAEYIKSGAEVIMAPEDFLVQIMGVNEDEVQGIMDRAAGMIAEEEALAAQDGVDGGVAPVSSQDAPQDASDVSIAVQAGQFHVHKEGK